MSDDFDENDPPEYYAHGASSLAPIVGILVDGRKVAFREAISSGLHIDPQDIRVGELVDDVSKKLSGQASLAGKTGA